MKPDKKKRGPAGVRVSGTDAGTSFDIDPTATVGQSDDVMLVEYGHEGGLTDAKLVDPWTLGGAR